MKAGVLNYLLKNIMIENLTNKMRGWALKVAGGLIDFSEWLGKRLPSLTSDSRLLTSGFEGDPKKMQLMPVARPMPADARKGEVFEAVLHGGALDGAVVPVKEGVRSVALMLVSNETSGFCEAYERWDGRYETQNGLLVGVYRWQMTVGKKKWGMVDASGETRDASGE